MPQTAVPHPESLTQNDRNGAGGLPSPALGFAEDTLSQRERVNSPLPLGEGLGARVWPQSKPSEPRYSFPVGL